MATVDAMSLTNTLKLIWSEVNLPYLSGNGSFRDVNPRQNGKTTITHEFGQIQWFGRKWHLSKFGQTL